VKDTSPTDIRKPDKRPEYSYELTLNLVPIGMIYSIIYAPTFVKCAAEARLGLGSTCTSLLRREFQCAWNPCCSTSPETIQMVLARDGGRREACSWRPCVACRPNHDPQARCLTGPPPAPLGEMPTGHGACRLELDCCWCLVRALPALLCESMSIEQENTSPEDQIFTCFRAPRSLLMRMSTGCL
jgi:hypothetical protein